MSNPHPTKSKPNKIGRKHTKQPSQRIKDKRKAGKKRFSQIKSAKALKYKERVSKYWNGELESHPRALSEN